MNEFLILTAEEVTGIGEGVTGLQLLENPYIFWKIAWMKLCESNYFISIDFILLIIRTNVVS